MFGRLGAAIVAVTVAAGGVGLWIAASGGAATGALKPKGCIDDNDAGQGEDSCDPSTDGLARVNAAAMSPDGKSLYTASEDDDAIVRFKRDTGNGALTPKGCIDDNDFGTDPGQGEDDCAVSVDGLAAAAAIAVSPDGKSLYAAAEEDDAIVRFKRDTGNGALTPKGCIDDNDTGTDPEQGEDDCATSTDGLAGVTSLAVSEDGKSLYAAAAEDDAIVRFKRDTGNGALTPKGCIDDNDTSEGQGPDDCVQDTDGLSEPGSIALSTDGKSLYVPGENDDAIVRLKRDTGNGALTPKGCIDDNDTGTDPGQGEDDCADSVNGLNTVESLALTPDGESLYAVGEDDAIVRFKRDTGNGALTPKGCIDDNDTGTDPEQGEDSCADGVNGLHEASTIAVSPDVKSLYVASGEDDAIVRFKRDTGNGALTPKGCIDDNDTGTDPEQGEDSCASGVDGLHEPDALVMSPDGKSFYAASEEDDAVVRFRRDTG